MKRWMMITACAFALGATATTATARSFWLPPARSNELRVTALHPTFDHGDLTALSMLWTASIDNVITPGHYFLCEIPIAHAAWESRDGSTTVGNPYFGWLARNDDSPWGGEFGVRLPLAGDDEFATYVAVLSEQVDCPEAWMPDFITAQAMVSYANRSLRTPGIRFGIGPSFWIYTEDDTNDLVDDIEIFFRYYVQFVLPIDDFEAGVGTSGRYLLTEEMEGLDERTIHELSMFAGRRSGVWRPAVRVRVPWDDELSEYLDIAFEISLGRGF